MIVSADTPPPPSELFASIVGAGAAEDSGPAQSTIDPSEYVCSTWNVYVFADAGWARNWNSESSPVGVFPPVHVTFVITALSPEPVCCICCVQPVGGGTNESIPNPSGTVITILLVVRLLFSVGTARLYSCSFPATDTGGLTRACADAPAGRISAIAHPIAIGSATRFRATGLMVMGWISFGRWIAHRPAGPSPATHASAIVLAMLGGSSPRCSGPILV